LPGHTKSVELDAYLAQAATLPAGTPETDFVLPTGASNR
jgi:hypothetical protein